MNKMNENLNIRATKFLAEHLEEIDIYIKNSKEEYLNYLSQNHGVVVKVVISHFVIEFYMNQFLLHHYKERDPEILLKLSFKKKISLLPKNKYWWPSFLSSLEEFDQLQSLFSNKLDYDIKYNDLKNIRIFVEWFFKGKNIDISDPTEIIEEFTKITCSFFII
jgi:hypothetical protein